MADKDKGTQLVVVGEPNGRLTAVFKKLSKLHTKNPDVKIAIVVGNLFAEENEDVADILVGRINVAIPTYFTIGDKPLPKSVVERLANGEEICENLHYLAKRSTTKIVEGLKIVTLGGMLDPADMGSLSQQDFLPLHTAGDAKALKGANTTDILLTSQWPAHIREGSTKEMAVNAVEPQGDENISDLCAAIRPRYHFSTSNSYYERDAFYHPRRAQDPQILPITKFVSVAPYGGKQTAMKAFKLVASPGKSHPTGTTPTPFKFLNKASLKRQHDAGPSSSEHDNHQHKKPKMAGPPILPEECFFCFAAPGFKEYLVTTIGDDVYLALPRGPLTTNTTNAEAGIRFPAHVLILPLLHASTLASVIDLETGQNRTEETYAEMTRFRKSLNSMVSSLGKGALGTVTYELSRGSMTHVHWQFYPIKSEMTVPQTLDGKSLVEAAFIQLAETNKLPTFETRDPGTGRDEGDFFRVWIWTPPTGDQQDGLEKCLTMSLEGLEFFPFQFGRMVLAKLLDLKDRENWWKVSQTVEKDMADVKAFTEAFAEFDISRS